MRTRSAAMSTARRNEFSRESANDCGTHDRSTILYNTIYARWSQSDERTPVRPSRTTDRECATSRVAGKPPSSWTTKKKKNNKEQSSPSGRMGAEEDAGQAPPAGRPPPCVPVAGPRHRRRARATETRRRAGRGGETERRKRSGGGYHRLLAAAGAVIGQPWKGERCSFRARTRTSYRYASFYDCRDRLCVYR